MQPSRLVRWSFVLAIPSVAAFVAAGDHTRAAEPAGGKTPTAACGTENLLAGKAPPQVRDVVVYFAGSFVGSFAAPPVSLVWQL
jgi:hypothetical protein